MAFCRACGIRWAQGRRRCRPCRRANRPLPREIMERAEVARIEADEALERLQATPPVIIRPNRVIEIDGTLYEITFDGVVNPPKATQ